MFSTGEHQWAFKNSRRTVESWAQIKMPHSQWARSWRVSFLPNSDLEGDNKRGSERAPGASRATERAFHRSVLMCTPLRKVLMSSDRLKKCVLILKRFMSFLFKAVHKRRHTFRNDIYLPDLDMCAVKCVQVCKDKSCGPEYSLGPALWSNLGLCRRTAWTVLSHQCATSAARSSFESNA